MVAHETSSAFFIIKRFSFHSCERPSIYKVDDARALPPSRQMGWTLHVLL